MADSERLTNLKQEMEDLHVEVLESMEETIKIWEKKFSIELEDRQRKYLCGLMYRVIYNAVTSIMEPKDDSSKETYN